MPDLNSLGSAAEVARKNRQRDSSPSGLLLEALARFAPGLTLGRAVTQAVPAAIGGMGEEAQKLFEEGGKLQHYGEAYYDAGPATQAAIGAVGSPGVPLGALGSSIKYPLYHGSPRAGLTYLEPSTRGPLGPGVYASPAEQIAKGYAYEGGPVYQLPAKDRDLFLGHGHRTDDEWFGFKADKTRLLDAASPEKKDAVAKILDKMWSSDGYPIYQNLLRLYKGDEGAQALYKRAGFEGLTGLVDGPEALLFGQQPLAGNKPFEELLARGKR